MYLIIVDTTQISPISSAVTACGRNYYDPPAARRPAITRKRCRARTISWGWYADPNRVIMDMHGGPTELNAEVLWRWRQCRCAFRDEEQAKAFTRKPRTVLESTRPAASDRRYALHVGV